MWAFLFFKTHKYLPTYKLFKIMYSISVLFRYAKLIIYLVTLLIFTGKIMRLKRLKKIHNIYIIMRLIRLKKL